MINAPSMLHHGSIQAPRDPLPCVSAADVLLGDLDAPVPHFPLKSALPTPPGRCPFHGSLQETRESKEVSVNRATNGFSFVSPSTLGCPGPCLTRFRFLRVSFVPNLLSLGLVGVLGSWVLGDNDGREEA